MPTFHTGVNGAEGMLPRWFENRGALNADIDVPCAAPKSPVAPPPPKPLEEARGGCVELSMTDDEAEADLLCCGRHCCSSGAAGTAAPEAPPPPDVEQNDEYLPNALTIYGLQHLCDNLCDDIHTGMPYWPEFFRLLKNFEVS